MNINRGRRQDKAFWDGIRGFRMISCGGTRPTMWTQCSNDNKQRTAAGRVRYFAPVNCDRGGFGGQRSRAAGCGRTISTVFGPKEPKIYSGHESEGTARLNDNCDTTQSGCRLHCHGHRYADGCRHGVRLLGQR